MTTTGKHVTNHNRAGTECKHRLAREAWREATNETWNYSF